MKAAAPLRALSGAQGLAGPNVSTTGGDLRAPLAVHRQQV